MHNAFKINNPNIYIKSSLSLMDFFSFNSVFLSYSLVPIICGILAFILYPNHAVAVPIHVAVGEVRNEDDDEGDVNSKSDRFDESTESDVSNDREEAMYGDLSLKEQLKTAEFWLLLYSVGVYMVRYMVRISIILAYKKFPTF